MTTVSSSTETSTVLQQLSTREEEVENTDEMDFLTLFIAQLENQDPLSPQENGEFLSQLAQFSQVEELESLNTNFDGFSNSLQSSSALQATSLIGRNVQMNTSDAYFYGDGTSISGGVELDAGASNVKVQIHSSTGLLMNEYDLGQQAANDDLRFAWDGSISSGGKAGEGFYTVTATVIRDGESVALPVAVDAQVQSVTLGNGGAVTLNIGEAGSLALDNVKRIY